MGDVGSAYLHVPDNRQAVKIGGYVPDEQAKR